MNIQVEEVALSLCGPCNQCTVYECVQFEQMAFLVTHLRDIQSVFDYY